LAPRPGRITDRENRGQRNAAGGSVGKWPCRDHARPRRIRAPQTGRTKSEGSRMATKQEIIGGLETLIRESRRLSTDLTDAQWQRVVDLDGWKSSEVLAHRSGIGGMVVPLVSGLTSAPAGADAFAAIDIDQI